MHALKLAVVVLLDEPPVGVVELLLLLHAAVIIARTLRAATVLAVPLTDTSSRAAWCRRTSPA